jgi:hypothetical protein
MSRLFCVIVDRLPAEAKESRHEAEQDELVRSVTRVTEDRAPIH